MKKKLTPAQALEAMQHVYDITFIHRPDYPESAHYDIGIEWPNGKYRALLPSPDWVIDWPSGVYQWPLPDKWRSAVMPRDYGKRCRFKNTTEREWKDGRLAGYCDDTAYNWVANNGVRWTLCEVED